MLKQLPVSYADITFYTVSLLIFVKLCDLRGIDLSNRAIVAH